MENEKITAETEVKPADSAEGSFLPQGENGGKNKKSLKWLWISIALAIVAAIAAWCIYNITKTEDKNTVLALSTVVALLFGVFLIATLGYLLGSISIKGVSLGTAGVFLVAIAFGYLSTLKGLSNLPLLKNFYIDGANSQLNVFYSKIIQNVGLVLFVASVGFIAGPNFFKNLKKNAKTYVLLGFVIIIIGGVSATLFAIIPGIGERFSAGILSGALTTTPGFSAAQEATEALARQEGVALALAEGLVENSAEFTQYVNEYVSGQISQVTLGHAIAYPFGVVGVVLFVQLVPKFMKADMNRERELLKVGLDDKVIRKGDYFKADEFGVMPFALAAICGLILGSIKIPLTSKGFDGTCFSLGTTGGVLIMCLIFGHFGHIGKLSLEIPDKTAKVFREFGLMLFLIGAGVSGGVSLVAEISKSTLGAMLILYGFLGGVVMTTLPMIVGFFLAKYALKISLLNNLGSITGGMTSTPALGTLISVAGTDDVASAYAATYPMALVSIVLFSQFIITLL